MEGSNRRTLIDSNELKLPNGLSINHASAELCWSDTALGRISCVSLDGFMRRRTLVQVVSQVGSGGEIR